MLIHINSSPQIQGNLRWRDMKNIYHIEFAF